MNEFEQGGALIGEHLCVKHQGNTSHYASHNCTICKLEAQVATLQKQITGLQAWKAMAKRAVPKMKEILKQKFMEMFDCKCFFCNVDLTLDTATRDHLTPKSLGGKNVPWNYVLSCEPCNRTKSATFPTQEQLDRAEKFWTRRVDKV